MTSDLEEADRARMRRGGVEMLSGETGLSLLDAALGSERAALLAAPFNPAGLRALASAGALAPILSALVRVPRRRRAASGSLAAKLATLPQAERERADARPGPRRSGCRAGTRLRRRPSTRPALPRARLRLAGAVELRNRLETAVGSACAATASSTTRPPAELAAHLARARRGRAARAPPRRACSPG